MLSLSRVFILIRCSSAWKLLPGQEFGVVTGFTLAELPETRAERCNAVK